MLTLYGDLDSGNVYKVRLLLAQLGTAYRRVDDHPKLGAAGELRFMCDENAARSRPKATERWLRHGCCAWRSSRPHTTRPTTSAEVAVSP
jgi:hypothetical protein